MFELEDFLTLDDVDLHGKLVFLRVDYNVPIHPVTKEILDDFRIRATLQTLRELSGAKVVVGSHQSRPGNIDFVPLKAHAARLRYYLGPRVKYVDGIFCSHAIEAIKNLRSGEVLILENLRFAAEENISDEPEKLVNTNMVRTLAPLFDYYVSDAFGTIHRNQPSIVALPLLLPSAIGRLMQRELRAVLRFLKSERRGTVVFALGGAKPEDRVKAISFACKVHENIKVLLGGLLAKIFLVASGKDMPESVTREISRFSNEVAEARRLLNRHGDKIILPKDFAVEEDGERHEYPVEKLPNKPVLDIGQETIKVYKRHLKEAATVLANGPMGFVEYEKFSSGTRSVLETIAKSSAYSVIGGGHLVALAEMAGLVSKFDHISTGGASLLTLLSGSLPDGLKVLMKSKG